MADNSLFDVFGFDDDVPPPNKHTRFESTSTEENGDLEEQCPPNDGVSGGSVSTSTGVSNGGQAQANANKDDVQTFLSKVLSEARGSFPLVEAFVQHVMDERLEFVPELQNQLQELEDLRSSNQTMQQIISDSKSSETTDNGGRKKKLAEKAEDNGLFFTDFGDTQEMDDKTPSFSSTFQAFLHSGDGPMADDSGQSKETDSTKSTATACFNCGGGHNLIECTAPKDFQKIKKNRQIFKDLYPSSSPNRYVEEKASRFSKFSPGVVSDELRQALGLRSNELPPWIYQMRVLGYPPGYARRLWKPKQKLLIYNEKEDKSASKTKADKGLLFDSKELVDYPGFTVPLPDGSRDDHAKYACPPMLPHHSKTYFMQYFQHLHPTDTAGKAERSSRAVEDMDISDDDTKANNGKGAPESPSVEFLEKERRRILQQLAGENSGKPPGSDECVDLASPAEPDDQGDNSNGGSSQPKTIPLDEPSTGPANVVHVAESLSVKIGTLVHSHSLSNMRAELDKFREGITPYEPPDESTSTPGHGYKALKKIIGRKR